MTIEETEVWRRNVFPYLFRSRGRMIAKLKFNKLALSRKTKVLRVRSSA
jgi:hypothetical protein